MVDFATFQHGGALYPLPAALTNSLLEDADPAIYNVLAYFKSVLTTYMGERLIAEATACGAPITAAVKMSTPIDPSIYELEEQFKFPLLAIYRKNEKFLWKTYSYMHDESVWGIEYILPPLTAGQAERINPILRSIGTILLSRIENMFDPSYNSGEAIWASAGVESVDLDTAEYGGYFKGNLFFPSWKGVLKVKERDMVIPDAFEDFTGIEADVDVKAADGTTVLDVADIDADLT